MDLEVCPRCRRLGERIIEQRGNRKYIYFYHKKETAGRWGKCYIGPAERYKYVEHIHNIGLKNIKDVNYLDLALRAVYMYIKTQYFEGKRDRDEVKENIREFIKQVREMVRSI
ncbi:MAG: hypothetical protein QW607_04480 [Desulfurococcaceae archaeon]